MPKSKLSPMSVINYEDDCIIELIRHTTGSGERAELTKKNQLTYLHKYLKVDHMDCKTIIIENEYVDRHYLEDYVAYYARCFPAHPRKCSRLHFFSQPITQIAFKNHLANENKELTELLQASYLGFAVIRPIPHTFFAKICLRPYGPLVDSPNCTILHKEVQVSLFGIPLKVDTAQFIEQDKVVSACATSALWMALSASQEMQISNLPSPSAITQSATQAHYDGVRTFPTSGLTPLQVARSLKHYGFEPEILSYKDNQSDTLKEHIYGYLSNSIPVILGGNVYEKVNEEYKFLGKHLVCVVGFHTERKTHAGSLNFLAHEIDKLYVHDDRYGPFMKMDMSLKTFDVEEIQKGTDGKRPIEGFELSIHGTPPDYFVPEVAVIGLNQKIRIKSVDIYSICSAFAAYLKYALDDVVVIKAKSEVGTDGHIYISNVEKSIRKIRFGCWDISLSMSTALKKELRGNKKFVAFNGMTDKSNVLVRNMPKYIWRCKIFERTESSEQLLTEILFDATEVPQGELIIGYIAYHLDCEVFWRYVEQSIKERIWQKYNTTNDNNSKQLIRCFIKFFGQLQNSTYLNTTYGPLGLPRRGLKAGETDTEKDIVQRPDVFTVRAGSGSGSLNFLEQNKIYIWVIDEYGAIVIGEDIRGIESKGHPTLIDGQPGRIAGELKYVASESKWVVNLRSRTYSSHIDQNSEEAKQYLNSVIKLNLSTLREGVVAEYTLNTNGHEADAQLV